MNIPVVVVFLIVTGAQQAFATLILPAFAAKTAVIQLFGLMFFKLSLHMLAMNAIRVGWRRQTSHTVPEYEQIIELLDVPEDIYSKRQLHQKYAKGAGNYESINSKMRDKFKARQELIASSERSRRRAWKMLFGNNPYVRQGAQPKAQ